MRVRLYRNQFGLWVFAYRLPWMRVNNFVVFKKGKTYSVRANVWPE